MFSNPQGDSRGWTANPPPLRDVLRNRNLMSWSLLDRTLLLILLSSGLPVGVLFYMLLYINMTLFSYIDKTVHHYTIIISLIVVVVHWILIALGIWQRQTRRNWPLLSHTFAQIFVCEVIAVSWWAGLYTSALSVLLLVALVAGLLLLEQRVVLYAVITGIITLIISATAERLGYLRYAPLFSTFPMENNQVIFEWALMQFLGLAGYLIVIWFIMTSIINQWCLREQELLAQMQTQEKLASLGEFSARIIHQTRHQLGLMGISVHNLSQHIEEQQNDSNVLDADLIKSEIRRLYEIQDKLRLTLKESLNMEPSGELSDQRSYNEILREEVENLQQLAQQKGVALQLQICEEQSRHCYPQLTEEWGQGLFNVIVNAVSAADKKVVIKTTTENNKLQIVISDDGKGIPESFISQAILPFVTTKSDGSGMGLAIANGVVEKEGGHLLLRNRETGGLDVVFTLPIDR